MKEEKIGGVKNLFSSLKIYIFLIKEQESLICP